MHKEHVQINNKTNSILSKDFNTVRQDTQNVGKHMKSVY